MDDAPIDFHAVIAAYLARFAQERNLILPPLGADGVGAVQRGSAVVTIHALIDKGVLLVLARVALAPVLTQGAAVRLLKASFVETGDAAFALHPQSGDLYLRVLRGLTGLDYEEFEDLIEEVASAADHWDDKLVAELGA